jgi:hypothetical protein
MVAFTYNMGMGYAGDVTGLHPADVASYLMDSTNPPTFAGQAVIATASGSKVRGLITSDSTTGTDILGITLRSYPSQQETAAAQFAAAAFGSTALPASGSVAVLRKGSIIVPIYGVTTACILGATVYVSTAASGGGLVLGGFMAAAGTSWALDTKRAIWGGPPFTDAAGNVVAELILHV